MNNKALICGLTGVVIDKLFISPHGSDDCEEDILGQDTLASGDKVDIKFHRSQRPPCGICGSRTNKHTVLSGKTLTCSRFPNSRLTTKTVRQLPKLNSASLELVRHNRFDSPQGSLWDVRRFPR